MNCKKCGAPLNPADKFCQNCGQAVEEVLTGENVINQNTNVEGTNPFTNTNTVQNTNVGGDEHLFDTQTPTNTNTTTDNPFVTNNNMNNLNTGLNVGVGQPQNQMPNNTTTPLNNNFNGYNQMQNFNNKKSNNNMIMIILGVVIVILIVVIVVLAVNGNKSTTGTSNKKNTETPTVTQTKTTTDTVLGNYTLSIPNEYTTQAATDAIYAYTEEKEMYLAILEGYKLAQLDLETTKAALTSEGYTVLEANSKTYGGVKMIVFGIDYNDTKELLVYAEIENNSILGAEIANISGELDYDTLEGDFASIAKSAKYGATTNSIKSSDISKNIEKFIKK